MDTYDTAKPFGWKSTVLIICIVLAIFPGSLIVQRWFDRTYDIEMAHIYRTVFSSPLVEREVGRIKDTQIMYADGRHGRDKAPKDWNRTRIGDLIDGTVKLFVLGDKGAGEFLMHYQYETKNDEFSVKDLIETKASANFNPPNQALAPMPMSITAPAGQEPRQP